MASNAFTEVQVSGESIAAPDDVLMSRKKYIDVTYAVAYSLMLLNTDLHVARGSSGHTKMSKAAFCSNTMATIREHQKTIDPIVLQKYGGSFDAWTEALEEHLKVNNPAYRQVTAPQMGGLIYYLTISDPVRLCPATGLHATFCRPETTKSSQQTESIAATYGVIYSPENTHELSSRQSECKCSGTTK